jgi:rifampicin phosphotransferase
MKALTEQDPWAELRRLGGGKALNLHMLAGNGWRVPAWAVIGADAFERFADDTGLGDEMAKALVEGDANRRRRLRARIAAAPVGRAVFEVIAEAYERAGAEAVVVRSSGTEEDTAANSFAGQFDSFLNVRGLERVVSHVKLCWASTFGERAAAYRRERGLSGSAAGMAVIVQALVRGEKSGVTFTANPANGNRQELVLSATFGLGPSLVDGSVDADTLVLDGATGERRQVYVGEKHARLDAAQGGEGCVRVELSDDERPGLSLSDDEIAELWRVGVEIQEWFGAPQDVEWTLAAGELWLLQSRPITSLGNAAAGEGGEPQGRLRVWDNSNIVESFGDITSPLTFTFTQYLYHQVHRWYCKSLKVPEHLLRDMDEWQSNRLAYFNGRVYYNLLNWYRMQHLLPFPGMKRQMMELAMGVEESISVEMAEDARPLRHRSRATERRLRLLTSTVFAWRFFTSGRDVRRFLERFDADFSELDKLDFDAMPAEELYEQVLMLDRELLPTWGPIVALEGVILTALGLLFGLTRRWLPDAPRWFYWNVGKPTDGVESAEPARAMTELADAALADPEIESIIREGQPDAAYERLAAEGKSGFLAAIDSYVERYGYRSVDDLKLEEVSMRDDVSVLFVLLRGALARPERQTPDESPIGVDRVEDRDPDAYLAAHMGRWRRLVYEVLRRKAQAGLAAREQVRFCRSRGFGLVRRMAWAVDRKLVQEGVLEQRGDVFQLRLEELRGAFEGSISHQELRPLIALRKRQREVHAELDPPPRFITRGPMYWYGNLERAGWYGATAKAARPAAEGVGDGQLQGVGCCPGRVVGEAKVLDAPVEVDGEVLVAYRTDPGWIAALPSVSALLVERGSPLTHVAVVARELGVPTVVQIKDLTTAVQTGMTVDVDGGAGTVRILSEGTR